MTKPPPASFLILSLLAVSGTFLILYATPQGMGLFDDSIAYIAGARSILAGQGYREAWLASNQPVTHFPPGFSTVLALVGLSGLDPLRGTRFVNSLLFGANIFLIGLIGWRMSKSKVAGIALASLFLLNASLFRVHTTAMSEPLYIFFTLAAFLTFSQYFLSTITKSAEEKKLGALGGPRGSNGFLLITAIITAFAYLTRYAGLALLATFVAALIILHDTWRKRLTSTGIFLAGFMPFALAWGIRNRLLADNATNRTIVYHPITAENIETGISNFAAFLLPVDEWRRALIQIPNLFPVVISIIFLALLIWTARTGWRTFFQPSAEPPGVPAFISALYVFGYLASILSSMTLFDASTKFQLRILAPVYAGLLTMLVYFGFWLWKKQRHSAVILALIIFSFSIYGMNDALTQLRKGGQGYASFQWFDSQAMKFLQTLPEDTRIYSNETAPVYLYTNRPGYVLPDLVDPVTGLPRGGFEEGVANLKRDVLSGGAVLALFNVGSQGGDSQFIYQNLTDGLYLAFEAQGDRIYTAFP
ncbi:MAG: hypothetical protein DPW18_01015 [Chloroflexi bacterium]|nr:hypothetical protein [Chloroflexota bacterium]MDL1941390.1 hypothetical protein [Chloroflexi bacterium CFX2]